ncbi:MAG: Ig-like domain-containing protein [Methanobrevibacter sp.]|nr:Ig-like domain-containing protein [Methanobrevibacter sp.]
MDIKTLQINLKNLMNKWFYTREQIHQLLEDYVTVDNNGILNVGLPSAEKITLTTANNAITTADVAEVTAKVTDNSNNVAFGVPVQFVNRATREVLYNGTTDENGECDFQYFTEEAEILPIQAIISNDYIFRDDGRLNSYTSWDSSTNVTLEHNSTNTRMYATDTSGATATLTSLVLAGYNDIGFKVKLVDGTATTDFCGIRECTSNGADVANGYTTDFNLDQLNLEVGEWYHFNITVLDDRFVLYCKETGENLRIWNDDGAPAYYKFVLYCDDDVSTIDFSDVRINKTSDDLSMFIKDKDNFLTHNQWTCTDYLKNTNGFTNSIYCQILSTTDYYSNGERSLKIIKTGDGAAYARIKFTGDILEKTITLRGILKNNSLTSSISLFEMYDNEIINHATVGVPANFLQEVSLSLTTTNQNDYLIIQFLVYDEAVIDDLQLNIQ